MMRFAELAAPWFETAEIIELHHDQKIDAPSGTAMTTARRMADASPTWGADPTTKVVVEGARGGVGPAGIRVHIACAATRRVTALEMAKVVNEAGAHWEELIRRLPESQPCFP